MKLSIDKDNVLTELPLNFSYIADSYGLRLKGEDRFNKSGSYLTGDRKYSGRKGKIFGEINALTDIDFNQKIYDLNTLFFGRRSSDYLYLTDTDNNLRLAFEATDFSNEPNKGLMKRLETINVSVLFPDVFWESVTENTSTVHNLTNNQSFNVTNNGTEETFPVIYVTPASDLLEFTIAHGLTGAVITVNDNRMTAGSIIKIDTKNGKITLTKGVQVFDIRNSISDNTGFFPLVSGSNMIFYFSPFAGSSVYLTHRELYKL